jgi:hypothetical protein
MANVNAGASDNCQVAFPRSLVSLDGCHAGLHPLKLDGGGRLLMVAAYEAMAKSAVLLTNTLS